MQAVSGEQMTPEDVRRRVDAIGGIINTFGHVDNEAAHMDEDELHQDVLRYIAENAPDPWRALAAMALETTHLYFTRWYS